MVESLRQRMTADKGKKTKVAPEEESEPVDEALVLSIEKLQEVQDDLEKVQFFSSLSTLVHV